MKAKLMMIVSGLLFCVALLPSVADARDRDERRSTYNEERGGATHTFHRDNNRQRDQYGSRDDSRGQGFYDRSESRRDEHRGDHHRRWRDRDQDRSYYRDEHRHYRDYDPYPRRIIVDHPRYHHPRRVIYYVDDWGYRRGYYVSDSYYEHYYDNAYFHQGRHHHIGCHYHGFFDAVATGIVISAIVGDW